MILFQKKTKKQIKLILILIGEFISAMLMTFISVFLEFFFTVRSKFQTVGFIICYKRIMIDKNISRLKKIIIFFFSILSSFLYKYMFNFPHLFEYGSKQ